MRPFPEGGLIATALRRRPWPTRGTSTPWRGAARYPARGSPPNEALRRGEILGLQWKAVNLKAGTIELLDQKNGDVSYVPLNPEAVKALRSVPRGLDSPFVSCGANGQPPCDFGRAFDAIVTKAKIPKCTFHALRHTFASHLAMSGIDILTIQKLMRHKTLTMTLRYSHLADQHVRKAVEHLTFKRTEENEAKKASQVLKTHA